MRAKEQEIKHKATTIEPLTPELRQKQDEIDKQIRRGPNLHPLIAQPLKKNECCQRTLELLNWQTRGANAKIVQQTARIQTLSERLATARHDREQMKQQLLETQQMFKAQPKVGSHGETECLVT